MSEDTDSDPDPTVPPMSAEPLPRSDGLRDALDALSDRVDTLSAMVLEATGGPANTGQASALDRRLQELIGQGPDQTGAELAALRGEIDALRGFVADRPNRPSPIAAAAADPLRETIMELARRIDMLGDVIHSSSGRGVGEQSTTTEPADTLAEQDALAEARFVEIMHRLDAVSRRGEPELVAPLDDHEKTVPDLAGSKGVMQRLDELTTRLDQLSAIVMAQQDGRALPPSGPGQAMPTAPLADTSGILSRLDEADRLRAQSREKMLAQMEKIATRMDWRLQRLEAAGTPVGAGVDEN